ncbi:MAG: peptidoglycan-binding domain-containing protein [Chthoniobacterales bacterium]
MKIHFILSTIALLGLHSTVSAHETRRQHEPGIPLGSAYNSNGRDATVRQVQLALQRRGYYVGLTTGEFVFETRQSIRRFRAKHGLRVNGKIDRELLRSLALR